MEVFLGTPAADGIGIGTAFVVPDAAKRKIPQKRIRKKDVSPGWKRFLSAAKKITAEINDKLSQLPAEGKAAGTQREIFETYVLMLDDPVFREELKNFYADNLWNIEYAIDAKSEEYASRLRNAGNEYLAERAQDITDIFGKVIDDLLEIKNFDINEAPDGAVIIARSLSPTDTIVLSKRKIAALALTDGGVASHVAILARSYGIPAVVGLENITQAVSNGMKVIVDGEKSEVMADPDEEILALYESKIAEREKRRETLKTFRAKSALSKDGVEFHLYANIGTVEEARAAQEEGAEGIGLFRTEFLYMSASSETQSGARPFDEDSQFDAYKRVLEIMRGKPVTIRTLDAGGDKLVNSVDIPQMSEKNPLMGLRAARLSLAYPKVLKTQLRALYRASVFGDLRIMLPLITSVEQTRQCKALAAEARDELSRENVPFNPDVPIGAMVETAAAAVAADKLAEECAFFSIGTNDLTQYTLGVDRENTKVSALYDEFNVSVIRLIARTIACARESGIPVSVCGEMASRRDGALALAGLGIRELSMSSKFVTEIKEALSNFSMPELEERAKSLSR